MRLSNLILVFLALSCKGLLDEPLFELLEPSQTGIDYSVNVVENDSINMLTFTNFYTGSGVGLGDINNDGLTDIYFGSCMESGRLYLNKGNMFFEDITEMAGVQTNSWITGVSMVDINTDGFIDIYLSVSGPLSLNNTKNRLFVNQGDLTFIEQASMYGIADTSQTTQSSFFDYDKDGDLDLFMIVNPTDNPLNYMGNIGAKRINGEATSTDKLFRNNGDNTFSDVSREAGILIEGFSLGLNTSDINGDGWIDVFVSNDFAANDILYINNGDGTFTDQLGKYFKHTSFASMGNDIADMNNDGLPDVYVCDMYPVDYFREKTLVAANNYRAFYYMLGLGYEPQYVRNVLQINNGNNTFSEIGQLAGLDKSDWSWAPLFGDLDNDGYKDLYITNGFTRDLGDLDFIKFNKMSPFANPMAKKADHYKAIVEQKGTKIANFAFRNDSNWTFSDITKEWGLTHLSFSNGLTMGDLDNDGDLDLVVSNINDPVFIYENQSEKCTNHFLKIILKGDTVNPQAIGAKVRLYNTKGIQYYEKVQYRGYLSTVDDAVHFGLGADPRIDSLEIIWPDGRYSFYKDIVADTVLTISYGEHFTSPHEPTATKYQFVEISESLSINYKHREDGFMDFAVQSLIPHEHAMNGPALAVGDINGDSLEDFYVGGPTSYVGKIFVQQKGSKFDVIDLPHSKKYEDNGALIFDVENDGDMDLYVVSGGTFDRFRQPLDFQDRLYLNNGDGDFEYSPEGLPEIRSSGSCVVASDFDRDGDLDLFIGGRVVPGKYPLTPDSYLLLNEGGKFTDVTNKFLPEGKSIGMVTSAQWTDYNNDLWPDLMIVGEWMPVKLYKNMEGKSFQLVNNNNLKRSNGWWNSLVSGDFDKDGDIDYVAGNLGTNTNYQTSIKRPVRIYAKDFDNNGGIDPIMSQYYGKSEHPVPLRDDLLEQISSMSRRFPDYNSYANATIYETFTKHEIEDALILQSNNFHSSYIENLGNDKFHIKPLPIKSQAAPVSGILVQDFNNDGNLDVLMVGNSYATHVLIGRYDAFTGACLMGDGNGNFECIRGNENGFFVDSDARSMVSLTIDYHTQVFIVGSNSDSLKVFKPNFDAPNKMVEIQNSDIAGIISLRDGSSYRTEFYHGSGYYSQSSRNQFFSTGIVNQITIFNAQGNKRIIDF